MREDVLRPIVAAFRIRHKNCGGEILATRVSSAERHLKLSPTFDFGHIFGNLKHFLILVETSAQAP